MRRSSRQRLLFTFSSIQYPTYAIEIFKLNVEAYPRSANVYDSLAEAYLKKGNKDLAIKFYTKALEVDPNFASAIEALRKLSTANP